MDSAQEDFEESVITAKDENAIHNLIRRTYVDRKPLCQGLHMTFEEFLPYVKKSLTPTFESKVSMGMRESASGRLVAFMLSRVLVPEGDLEIFGEGGLETEKSNQYSKVLHDLCADVDILKDGRFNKQLELQCLCVHPNYGNKGLGMKLVRLSEEKGKDLGCDVATIQAVNAVTDHISKKTGYTTVRRVDVRDIRDEMGRPLLDLRPSGKAQEPPTSPTT